MNVQIPGRDDVRHALRVYMSRTGLSLGEIALRSGFATQTLQQFVSAARFGTPATAGEITAGRLAGWLAENPAPLPELPGKLYPTEATRAMDRLIDHAREGGWGILYGPAGAQKTFLLEYRAAEAAHAPEPALVVVGADPDLSPRALLGRVAAGLAAPYACQTDSLRQAILYALRQRKTPVALAIDEAQLLYSRVDTLEVLRRLGDAARQRMGILVAGNEQVINLFEPRRRNYFEQWRSRIDQERARVLGPSISEARAIVASELPEANASQTAAAVEASVVTDPIGKKQYVNARRLFNTIRAFQRVRRNGKAKVQ